MQRKKDLKKNLLLMFLQIRYFFRRKVDDDFQIQLKKNYLLTVRL
ncbi:hypothetical protein QIA00_04980 (plasmid) [Borreliella americana]|uniref:Uncharacterized protein n=1 Tax=Borreliella americana TaxID=478807 RepID=A0ACD5G5X6_9SPIR